MKCIIKPLTLSFLILANCLSAQTYLQQPVSPSKAYICVNVDSSYNLLARFSKDKANFYFVDSQKTIERFRAKVASKRRQRRKALSDQQSTKASRLKQQIKKLKKISAGLKNCVNEQGLYSIPFGSGGSGGGGTSSGDNSNNNGDTVTSDQPCDVVGNRSASIAGQPVARIINGDRCIVGNSPVVDLELRNVSGNIIGYCSGVAVTKRIVITAAHCTERVRSALIMTGRGQVLSSAVYSHSGYTFSEKNDVGVIVASSDLPIDTFSVIPTSERLRIGEEIIFAGYGLDNNGKSGVLRATRNTISNFTTGSITLEFRGTDEGNTCSGDSGGPLLVKRNGKWLVAGVTSNGLLFHCGQGDISNFANLLDPSNRRFFNSISSEILN